MNMFGNSRIASIKYFSFILCLKEIWLPSIRIFLDQLIECNFSQTPDFREQFSAMIFTEYWNQWISNCLGLNRKRFSLRENLLCFIKILFFFFIPIVLFPLFSRCWKFLLIKRLFYVWDSTSNGYVVVKVATSTTTALLLLFTTKIMMELRLGHRFNWPFRIQTIRSKWIIFIILILHWSNFSWWLPLLLLLIKLVFFWGLIFLLIYSLILRFLVHVEFYSFLLMELLLRLLLLLKVLLLLLLLHLVKGHLLRHLLRHLLSLLLLLSSPVVNKMIWSNHLSKSGDFFMDYLCGVVVFVLYCNCFSFF